MEAGRVLLHLSESTTPRASPLGGFRPLVSWVATLRGTSESGGVVEFRSLQKQPAGRLPVLVVLAVFVFAGAARYWFQTGDDLASSYVGCRLVASGQAAHLYSHDAVSFDEIGEDDTWQDAADAGHAQANLHPYVQTPLWAFALEPLCTRVYYKTFDRIFNVLAMLSFGGCLGLTARYWARSLWNVYGMAAVALCVYFSVPFQYSMYLMQTHVLFILMTIGALILAEKDRPIPAGLLLAAAAAVKITPGFLVLYWLVTRRWKAAGSMAVWSAAFWVLTVALGGRDLMRVYLADLQRVSHVLLLYQNNQSFAAWVMGRFYPYDEVFDIFIHPLPAAVRISSSILTVGLTLAGGLIDRMRLRRNLNGAPLGALIALVAATAFAPIAWTHYSIILIPPVMVIASENRAVRSVWIWAALLLIVALNYPPLASDVVKGLIGPWSILRGHFYACLLTILTLGSVAWLGEARGRASQAAGSGGPEFGT